MFRLTGKTRNDGSKGPNETPSQLLPLRWLVIGTLAAVAGMVGGLAGGVVAAIPVGVAVAAGLHKITE